MLQTTIRALLLTGSGQAHSSNAQLLTHHAFGTAQLAAHLQLSCMLHRIVTPTTSSTLRCSLPRQFPDLQQVSQLLVSSRIQLVGQRLTLYICQHHTRQGAAEILIGRGSSLR